MRSTGIESATENLRTNASGDCENIGIKDNVLRKEVGLFGEELVRALANLELALSGGCLTLFVEL